MNDFIKEAMHDFYKEQTFYNSARKYPSELKKQIIAFFQSKQVSLQDRWGDGTLDTANLQNMNKTDKKKKFIKVLKDIEISKGFFQAAKTGYSNKIKLPTIIYNNFELEISLASNEEFFDIGHDLEIEMKIPSEGYKSKREFKSKINLMQSIPQVLDKIWNMVENSIKKYNETEEPEQAQTRQRYVKSDMKRVVRQILNVTYKTYKSGKRAKITDWEKLPVLFNINMDKKPNERTLNDRRDGFTLRIQVKKLKSSSVKDAGKYSSKVNPNILEKYPDIAKWVKILDDGIKEVTGKSYGRYNNVSQFIGEKYYTDDHEASYKRLQFAVRKFAKMGYIPDKGFRDYGGHNSAGASIHFKYSENVKDMAINNISMFNNLINRKEYTQHVKHAFFSNGKLLNNIPRELIYQTFNIKK